MNIWQQLEIEPTSDLKIIKRAYAKKLKVTRPDEDPKSFQDLHYAYKTALYHASRMDEGDEDKLEEYESAPVTENLSITTIESDDLIIQHAEIIQAEFSINQKQEVHSKYQLIEEITVNPLQVESERLLDLARLFLLTSAGSQNNPKNWSFILESPYILDDRFNWQLSVELLRLIHQHNSNHMAKVQRLVGRDALTYLNDIFNWTGNYHQLLQILENDCSTWLDLIVQSGTATHDWQDKIRGGTLKLATAKQVKHKPPIIPPKKEPSNVKLMLFIVFIVISAANTLSHKLYNSEPYYNAPKSTPTLNAIVSSNLNQIVNPKLNPALNSTIDPTLNPIVDSTFDPNLNSTLDSNVDSTLDQNLNPILDQRLESPDYAPSDLLKKPMHCYREKYANDQACKKINYKIENL